MKNMIVNAALLCVISFYSFGVRADLLDENQQAFIQFQDLSRKATSAYQMPRLYTQEGSELLMRIADEGLLTDVSWNEENMAYLVTVCDQVALVELLYKLYGIKSGVKEQQPLSTGVNSAFIETADLEHEFQNEISFLTKYQIRCTSKTVRLYSQYLGKLNHRQLVKEADGIAAYRENAEALIKEVISTLSDPKLHPSNRLDPIKLVADEADALPLF